MSIITDMIVPIFAACIASNALFGFVMYLINRNDTKKDLLRGLAHDRIKHLCVAYIERGDISEAEFEELTKYLYEPYKRAGGNGTIEKLYNSAIALPLRTED